MSANSNGVMNAMIGEAAQFDSPLGVAVDSEGDLYVGDARNSRISGGTQHFTARNAT
ncbi:MAG: hypothetical protein ACLQVX_20880 [Limisphaerales bacterium]